MSNNRRLRRWHLIYYLRVFERDSGELLGHVVDVTADGMRLISADPIALGEEYAVWLEVPTDGASVRRLDLEMKSLWCSTDVNPMFHDTGFRLVDPSPDVIEAVEDLINDLHFTGPPVGDNELHSLSISAEAFSHPGT